MFNSSKAVKQVVKRWSYIVNVHDDQGALLACPSPWPL